MVAFLWWVIATLPLPLAEPLSSQSRMPSPARVLVIGAGSISREYALHHLTSQSTGCVVVGIVDSDLGRAQKLAGEVASFRSGAQVTTDRGNKYRSRVVSPGNNARTVNVPFYPSIDDALSAMGTEVDVVYVGTPPGSHRHLVERALDDDKHVLLEKPLASSAEDADAIVAAADGAEKKRGIFLGMNIGMRYNAALTEMRRRILENDEFGLKKDHNPRLVATLRLHFRQWPREWQTQPWCASRSEGGPCREVGTHFFSALLEFANGAKPNANSPKVLPLMARVKATVKFPTTEVHTQRMGSKTFDPCENSAHGTIELVGGALPPGGLTVDLSVQTEESSGKDLYELTIASGSDDSKALTLFDFCSLRHGSTGEIFVQNADYGRKECVEALISAAFCKELENRDKPKSPPIVTAKDGRKVQLLLDAILNSQGEWKDVDLS